MLGDHMNEGLTPGWYTSDEGHKRYWDGKQWLMPEQPALAATPEPARADSEAVESKASGPGVSVTDDVASAPTGKPRRGVLVAAVIGAVAMVGGGAAWWFGTANNRLDTRAIAECEDALLGMLKNPTAAVFYDSAAQSSVDYYSSRVMSQYAMSLVSGDYSDSELDEMGTRVDDYIAGIEADEEEELAQGVRQRVVYGEVDTQNGFGAVTREEWACSVKIADGELGTPIVLTFGDEYTLGGE
jgi:hypothetical protein